MENEDEGEGEVEDEIIGWRLAVGGVAVLVSIEYVIYHISQAWNC